MIKLPITAKQYDKVTYKSQPEYHSLTACLSAAESGSSSLLSSWYFHQTQSKSKLFGKLLTICFLGSDRIGSSGLA